MTDLKLKIELVPSTTWKINVRSHVKTSQWDKIRKKVYALYGEECAYCGRKRSESRLHCHEVWDYDYNSETQRLTGFVAVCTLCSMVKHIGFASGQSFVSMEDVENHFMTVNECDRETFLKHKKEAFDEWREMSKIQWKIELVDNFDDLMVRMV